MSDRLRSFTESLLEDIENDEVGSFKLDQRDGDAYLKVFQAGKNGKPVDPTQVMARIELLGIEKYSKDLEKIKPYIHNISVS